MSAALALGGLAALELCERFLNANGAELTFLLGERSSRPAVVALAAAAAVLGATLPRTRRLPALLAVSAGAYPIFLGASSVLVLGYAALVCGVARLPVRLRAQIAAALLPWAAVPVGRWVVAARGHDPAPLYLMLVWAGLAYSSIYLLVERARHREPSTLVEDLFYLLALPRVLSPFFQPISPSYLYYRHRPSLTPARVGGAVALGAYGMALQVVVMALRSWGRGPHPSWLEVPAGILGIYGAFGAALFGAVALFRLLGFELASGFRQPFLARSFADYFARFNHYIRDAVISLFYIPLFARLRHRLAPRTAAIASGYLAILVGSFLLNQVLVPLVTSADPAGTLEGRLDPVVVAMMLAYWTAIVVPSAPPTGGRAAVVASRRPAALEVAMFLASFGALASVPWAIRHLLGHA